MQINGYKIEGELGSGGMSKVYLATQESLGRQVAVKVMSPALAADAGFGERFLKEGRTVARLNHPNILAVHDLGVDGHCYYLVMEYVPGGDLKQRIRQEGLAPEASLIILREIASALAYAHGEGFVHRDVKPENVLFRKDGTAVLSDFGIAKAVGSGTKMTGTGMSIGTPHYMSPEQARGQEVDGRSDLYSLGVVFYEMLTGRVPYEAQDSFAVAYAHINDPLPQLPSDLSRYQPLLGGLLAKNPADRFEHAAELVDALNQVLAGKTPPPPRKSASPKTQVMKASGASSAMKGSALKWAAGGALLAALAVGGLVLTNGSKPRPVLGGGGTSLPAASQGSASATAPPPAAAPVQAALGKGQAILMVSSEPTGAKVYLGDHHLGATPLTRDDLPAGKFNLTVKQKYHDDATAEIALADAEVVKKRITLRRGNGKVTVLTEPAGATVYFDGKPQKEKTPLTLRPVGAGEHTLKVHLDTYYDVEQEVEVLPDQTAKVDLTLKGGHLVAYKGEWLEPEEAAKRKAEDAAKRKAEDAEKERQRLAEEKRREEEKKKRSNFEKQIANADRYLREALSRLDPAVADVARIEVASAAVLFPQDPAVQRLRRSLSAFSEEIEKQKKKKEKFEALVLEGEEAIRRNERQLAISRAESALNLIPGAERAQALLDRATKMSVAKKTYIYKNKMGNVNFRHESHQSRFSCNICHHNGMENPRCFSCHGVSSSAPNRKKMVHANAGCKGCHKKHGGPTGCKDCHKR